MTGSTSRAWSYAALVAGLVVAADQVTKHLINSSLADGDTRHVIPGVELVHATNNGVAFSVSAGGPTLVLVVIGIAVLAIIGYFATHHDRPLIWLPTGMMIGGAVGNLVDRIRLGAVTDFIKLPHWPAFNLADASITLGVVALLFVLRDDGSTSTR
ncbi:MAG TPA: signal peptidase II [Solirubrobacteraceae bacterium]|nr:signal peptidase II [Solirubrobacteraceae bacterium]